MPISDELKRIYVTAPVDEYYIETLELSHPLFSDGGVRYISNQRDGWTGDLETGGTVFFQYVPFSAIPPSGAENANLALTVVIDNTSKGLMDELELLSTQPTTPISLVYRVYLKSDPATVQNVPPLKLDILSVTATNNTISFVASMANLRGRPFPKVLYTTALYPGLAR